MYVYCTLYSFNPFPSPENGADDHTWLGDGALRAPSESTGMVAIPLEPRVS